MDQDVETVDYFDDDFRVTDKEHATLVKVVYKDGRMLFGVPTSKTNAPETPEETVERPSVYRFDNTAKGCAPKKKRPMSNAYRQTVAKDWMTSVLQARAGKSLLSDSMDAMVKSNPNHDKSTGRFTFRDRVVTPSGEKGTVVGGEMMTHNHARVVGAKVKLDSGTTVVHHDSELKGTGEPPNPQYLPETPADGRARVARVMQDTWTESPDVPGLRMNDYLGVHFAVHAPRGGKQHVSYWQDSNPAKTESFYSQPGKAKSDVYEVAYNIAHGINDKKEQPDNPTAKPQEPEKPDYSSHSINQLAREIRNEWGHRNVHFAAQPYLSSMMGLDSVHDNDGMDSGKEIVARFLANASTFRGPKAKAIKEELKRRLKSK